MRIGKTTTTCADTASRTIDRLIQAGRGFPTRLVGRFDAAERAIVVAPLVAGIGNRARLEHHPLAAVVRVQKESPDARSNADP